MLDSLPSAAAIVDRSGHTLASNQLWRDQFGDSITLEEPLAWRLLEHAVREVFDAHQQRATPIVHTRQGRWFQTHVSRLAAREDGVLVIHEDVTSFRSAQHQARELLEATSGAMGPALLRAVTRQLAQLTGSRYAWVGKLDFERPGFVVCTALWDAEAEQFLPDVICPLAGTPCESSLAARALTVVPTQVQLRFPNDPLLVAWKLDGYLGVPLQSLDGEPMGLLAAAHTSRLDTALDPQLLRGLATRAGAELARARAEDALRQSQERLELALFGTDDGVFDWDLATRRVRGTPRLTEMLGYSAAELPDLDSWHAITHPEDRDRVNAAIVAHLKGHTPVYRAELRMRAKDGSFRWLLDRGKVVERGEDGRARRMTGLHTDIEERKRLEAQVQISGRMASVGTLAATLAHELNTPLSYLSTGLTALAVAGDARGRAEALQMAQDGAKRINEVVRDVKTFSHVNPGAAPTAVDVAAVVHRAERLARHLVEQRGRLEVAVGSLPLALGDDAQLSHVFLNLLVNAAQSLPDDGRSHRVRVSGGVDARGWIVIEVHDSGEGIPPGVGARVFEPFFTTRRAGEGTGLGLALCQDVVRALGGEISFTSEPGATCFRVVLRPAPAARETPTAAGAPVWAGFRRVLVIDDHPAMGTSLKLMLRDEHEVDSVTSAAAALERLEQVQYDVILCDLMMPGVTGADLYRKVLELRPTLAERFVFMTGGTTNPKMQQFLEQTQRQVLEKPFAPELLRAVLGAHSRPQ